MYCNPDVGEEKKRKLTPPSHPPSIYVEKPPKAWLSVENCTGKTVKRNRRILTFINTNKSTMVGEENPPST